MLIPTDLFAAATICAGRDESRYYLNGVFLDSRGYVASTDGHRAFFGKLKGEMISADLIVPRDVALRAIKAAKKAANIEYCKEDGRDWLLAGSERIFLQPIDGTFPAWDRIFPAKDSFEQETPAKFNAKHYGDLGKMAKLLVNSDTAFSVFQKVDAPAGISFGNRDDCGAALMPIRQNDAKRWQGVV